MKKRRRPVHLHVMLSEAERDQIQDRMDCLLYTSDAADE